MKLIFIFLIAFGCPASLPGQIKWSETKPLTWKDFNGTIDYTSKHFANTKTSINYQYQVHYHNKKFALTFYVECVFIQKGSWYKPYKQNIVLLQHEQLHFDIQEIFARKLLLAFNNVTYTADYQKEVKNIYDGIAQQANIMQKKYDDETNYGEIKTAQLKWMQLIQQELIAK